MKRIALLLGLSLLPLSLSRASAFAQEAPSANLSPEHRRWIEEEAFYIITEREREFFLSLESEEERDRFIEAFWRKRDPNPVTPENEFRAEHYRRIEYADQNFGRDSFSPGWKTDRGKMYVLLGEPRERQRYDGLRDVVSSELWFYQGEPGSGLPSFFYLLFFRPREIGEYRLYHPALDGPRALLRGRYASLESTDPAEILTVLNEVAPELGRASLSLDPSDPGDYRSGRASLGTDILLTRIEEFPKRRVRTDYLDAASRYDDRVEADYSFNFVPNRSAFAVLMAPDGGSMVHYSIELEPQDVALETDERRSKYYTTVDVTLEVRNQEENLVYSEERAAYVELTPSQMEQVKSWPFAFQGSFPLVPGRFMVSVLLKNRVMKRYTVAEREIEVPARETSAPVLGDPVLAFASETSRAGEGQSFQLGAVRVHPAADRLFSIGETVGVFVQVKGAAASGRVRMTLEKGEELLQEITAGQANEGDPSLVTGELSLEGVQGGAYTVAVELVDSEGAVVARRSAEIQVTPRTAVPRAGYIHRSGFDVGVPGLVALARGEQLWASGRVEEARAELEKAVAADNPAIPSARWKLASIHLRANEIDRALELLLPLESEHGDQYEVVAGLGFAYYFAQDFAKAAKYLDRASSLRPPRPSLLNALGEAHERNGELAKAKAAFERSLEIQPGQKAIEERLASLSARGR